MPNVMNELTESEVREADFIEALQSITEARGTFKRDPFAHAKSVIHDMHEVAVSVLRKHGIEPRRAELE